MTPPPNQQTNAAPGTWAIDWTNLLLRSRRLQTALARRWAVILISTVLAGTAAAYWAVRSPDIYQASSRLGIAPRIQTAFHSQAQYLEELNNFYDSQLQYLTSSKVQERVAEKMRQFGPPPPNALLATSAHKQPGSFTLQVESTNLEHARRFATIWAREFLAFKTELRENAIGRTAASTREDILRYERNLEQARATLLEFQRKNSIGSAKETGDAAQQRLDKLEGEYQDLKTLRQRLENKSAEQLVSGLGVDAGSSLATDSAAATRPAGAAVDPLAPFEEASRYADLRLRLKTVENDVERARTTLKPKHPHMRKIENDARMLRQEITFQLELIEEKRLARIQSLKEDEQSYLPLIEGMRHQVLASRNIQYEFERLRDEENNVKAVLHGLRKAEESLNATTADDALFHIIEEGVGASVPIRPNRPKLVLTGLMLGLAVGLGLAYLLGRLDDRFESPDEIQAALEEPVLAQLPNIDRKSLKLDRLLITSLAENHLYRESLRGLRSALFPGNDPRVSKLILLTSAAPGEGKTTVSVNLASTLAVAGHRVLLIDADLRRGDTHNFFKNSRTPGLSEILNGQPWREVLRTTEIKQLNLIHSGTLPRNPGELLLQPSLPEFIRQVRDEYDTVLIDCPPLSAVDDTFTLSGLADGLLFIVRASQTSMRLAARSLDALRQRGAPLRGLILNGLTAGNPFYYYHHYYYGTYAQPHPEDGQRKITGRAA